ncbi:MAG: OmpA family protein [Bacteroidetes bacterium]|nr:OmpA family protein [Bacteroidota bacterium]
MRPVYTHLALISSALLSLTGCVSTGKYKAMELEAQKYDTLYTYSMRTLKSCQDANADLTKQRTNLQNQVAETNMYLNATKESNTQLKSQLKSLSALTSAQAESIKKSLDNIGAKDSYIMDLQTAIARRDSLNLNTLLNLKAAFSGIGSQDAEINLDKGVVYVELSDKLLFTGDSASSILTDKGRTLLGRLARVLNSRSDIEISIEGHADSVQAPPTASAATPAFTDSTARLLIDSAARLLTDSTAKSPDSTVPTPVFVADNWELSAKRATSIARVLQHDYHIDPSRMTAAGRAANRRNRITILPQTEQLLKVLGRGHGQESQATVTTSAGL